MTMSTIEDAGSPVVPISKKLDTIDCDSTDFRENSVRILAGAVAKGPSCWMLPYDLLGILSFSGVDQILRNPAVFSSKVYLSAPAEGIDPATALLKDDPPEHTRLRSLFGQIFTPARVSVNMEPRVLAIARRLVDKVLAGGRELDLMRDIAVPLPVTVISELLGVDAGQIENFRRWSDDITAAPIASSLPDGAQKTQRLNRIHQSMRDLDSYLKDAIEDRRRHPGDDLLTLMLNASEAGDKLSAREVLSLAKLLLVAGNETTTKLTGLMMNLILKTPGVAEEIGETPGLLPGAIEETLRMEGPIYSTFRKALKATAVAGVSIPEGTVVACVMGAANLDPAVFSDPLKFDIRRKIARHLGFGGGIHQCLGAPLARLELRIVFEEIFSKMADLEFAGAPVRGTTSAFRGFDKMPLRYQLRAKKLNISVVSQIGREVAVADKISTKSDEELGLDKRARETVRVTRVKELAEGIKLFRLVHPSGGLLTRFTAGSHIVIHMRDGAKVYRNAYSLLNSGYGNGLDYIIAVALDPNGKGGSRYLHEKVRPGMELLVSVPANNFPSAERATKHLLIAGGIGITPLLALRSELRSRGEPVALHYSFRAAAKAILVEELELEADPGVTLYDNSLGRKLDVEALIRSQPEGTHVYVCGPEGLMDAVIKTALGFGWPKEQMHFERFGAKKVENEKPFEVLCQRSGISLTVGSDTSLLEALEHAGLNIPFACRAGSCGACQLTVLEGRIDHRDSVLSAAEKAEGNKILACVSRGVDRLVLDV